MTDSLERLEGQIGPLAISVAKLEQWAQSIDRRLETLNGRVPILERTAAEQTTKLAEHALQIAAQAKSISEHGEILIEIRNGLKAIEMQLAVSASAKVAAHQATDRADKKWEKYFAPVVRGGQVLLALLVLWAFLFHGNELRQLFFK